MRYEYHTAVSVLIAATLLMIFKSWGMAAASLVAGVFIDLDHVIDYVREHGLPVKMERFFYALGTNQFNRLFLILHGWEWLFIWGMASWLSGWNPWITGALIGMTQHMIFDLCSNGNSFSKYSLIYRWKNGFDSAIISKKY